MSKRFPSLLRQPDSALGSTDASPFRFEEDGRCDVQYSYEVYPDHAAVRVYPSGSPVRLLKLRFRADLSFAESVMGDEWERSSGDSAPIEWRSVTAQRRLPWYCVIRGDGRTACYGVKTGADCFAYWQVDTHGISLVMNLMSASQGTDLREPLLACEIVERVGEEGEDSFAAVSAFCAQMCEHPVLPREPIFGVNNWYWAYGRISHESVMTETDYLLEMTEGCSHRPFMILDDGWQMNRTYGGNNYIGGPWIPNERFGDITRTVAAIREKGAKPGIWFRPLLTLGEIPDDALYRKDAGGQIMDPSHPYTLERVERDAGRIRSWGFELIKHDFTSMDLIGGSMQARSHGPTIIGSGLKFHDRTRTTATIIKELYRAIQRGAGAADVIGCNVIGHLSAGIHSAQRVGGDTSGRSFEWTVRNGVNSMMRLPQNGRFFLIDPDCAAFTEQVNAKLNLDFLEMCAVTGVTTLASVTPGILRPEEMRRIRDIYRIADSGSMHLGIVNYEKTAQPEFFSDSADKYSYDWSAAYDGSRSQLSWLQ